MAATGSNARSPVEVFTQHSQQGANAQRTSTPQRGRVRGDRPPRESRWPKNSDIPKADPQRRAMTWEDDNCSFDSARADSGFDEGNNEPTTPAGIDPDTGFMLTDFSGSWAPAPINWDSRPAFRPNQSSDVIEKWKQRIEVEMVGKTRAISLDKFVASDGRTYCFSPEQNDKDSLMQGDIAPQYWSPVVIGDDSPNTFWRKLTASDKPEPVHADDLAGAKPWWEKYASPSCCSLQPLKHPEIKGIHPSETQQERLRRENDHGSMYHAANRKRAELAKKDADRERRKKAMEKARKLSAAGGPLSPSLQIKPQLALYLRPACPEDIPRIKEIYNHYVENSVCVPETERRKEADMSNRYNDIISKKLPFLVACERGTVLKGRKGREPVMTSEKLVGFAYADDHHDLKGMYRFTCDIEIYVDSAYYMKGIGKCLMDKLLGMLDPDYIERGGCEVEGAELEGVGVSRCISNIIATVPFEKEERLEWKGRFLSKFAGFNQVGLMKETGVKLGHSVSVAIFQKKTGFQLDPTTPPIMADYSK